MESVSREELLKQCEAVSVAVAAKPSSNQSHCLGFRDGLVLAYDTGKNILVSAPSGLNGFTGALRADLFLELLRKLPDDELKLDISNSNNHLSINPDSSCRINRLAYEKEVLIPTHLIDPPKDEWVSLSKDFLEAIDYVQRCCNLDTANSFAQSCVHVLAKSLEATNRYQAARWCTRTRMGGESLIPREGVRYLASLGMTEIQRTETGWVHFRNPSGVVLSCQWYETSTYPYEEISPIFDWEGDELILPRGLEAACERAEIFSSQCGVLKKSDNFLVITLSKRELIITGQSILGELSDRVPVKYNGKPMSFTIPPKVFSSIVKKHSECLVTPAINNKPARLKVVGDNFDYCTVIGEPENKPKRSIVE